MGSPQTPHIEECMGYDEVIVGIRNGSDRYFPEGVLCRNIFAVHSSREALILNYCILKEGDASALQLGEGEDFLVGKIVMPLLRNFREQHI